jgi:hypothetical protein
MLAPIQPADTSASQTGSALASDQTTSAAEPATAPPPPPAESPAEASNNARPAAPSAPAAASVATSAVANVPERASTVDKVPHTLASRLMAAAKTDASRSESLTNVNRLLNTANIELSDLHIETSKEKSNEKKLIETVNEELAKQGIEKIRAEDITKIAAAQPTEIRQNVERENRPIVQALAAESRTKEISHDTKPATPAESNIVNLLKTANQTEPVTIQSAPEGNRLERVTDLSVPAKTTNVGIDAKARVTGDLKQAIGQNVELKPKDEPTTESPTGTVARFEQVVKADNKALPIFGSETELYYSKEATPKLTAITNKTVSVAGLVVKGVAGELSIGDAKTIVAKELKVDAQLLKDGKEGIYLVGDNSKNARVSVLIPVRVDDHHEDIKVYVDSQTKQILDIK